MVHLKGRRALTASPEGMVWVNTTGNPGAATGGTGDVLTGIISSLIAQGMTTQAATWSGAYLHGMASDRVASRMGMRSLAAGDLPDALAGALLEVGRATHTPTKLRTVLRP